MMEDVVYAGHLHKVLNDLGRPYALDGEFRCNAAMVMYRRGVSPDHAAPALLMLFEHDPNGDEANLNIAIRQAEGIAADCESVFATKGNGMWALQKARKTAFREVIAYAEMYGMRQALEFCKRETKK